MTIEATDDAGEWTPGGTITNIDVFGGFNNSINGPVSEATTVTNIRFHDAPAQTFGGAGGEGWANNFTLVELHGTSDIICDFATAFDGALVRIFPGSTLEIRDLSGVPDISSSTFEVYGNLTFNIAAAQFVSTPAATVKIMRKEAVVRYNSAPTIAEFSTDTTLIGGLHPFRIGG